ncbi:MAG: SNF2-related protein [Cetobacterium sp.]
MALFNLISKIFKTQNLEGKYEFKNSYKNNLIEIEVYKDKKKIYLTEFNQKEYEYLLKTDIFQINDEKNILELPYENIYVLDEETITFFNLPKYFLGTLRIENETNFLNISGVKFKIEFVDTENRYEYKFKNLIIRETDGRRFFLKEKDFYLVQEIYLYNNDSDKNIISTEQYKIVEKIRKLKEKKEILIGSDIQKIGNIDIVQSLELDFEEKDEKNMEVFPILKDVENYFEKEKIIEAFKKEFKDKRLQKIYTLKIDGKEHEVVLNNELLKVLQVVKENENTISKENFIKKDGPIFSDERMNVENLDYNYGPRVKGLGYLNYRATPTLNNSDTEWFSFDFPYIDTTDGEQVRLKPENLDYLEGLSNTILDSEEEILVQLETDDGKRNLFLNQRDLQSEILKLKNSFKEVLDFKKSKDLKNILNFLDENNWGKYAEYNGYYITPPESRKSLLKLIEDKEAEENQKIDNETKKEKVLLLKDNIEELEHTEDNSKSNVKYEYEKPQSLRKNINLLPYQRDGVAMMQGLYTQSIINGVLLSDDMGLGKTLQILTFLAWLKERKTDFRSIIVVPTSLITNWYNEDNNDNNQGEIQKFFEKKTFKVEILKGKLNNEILERIKESNIVILSYETLRISQLEFAKIEWDVIVCDEAQKIKNPTTLLTTAIKAQNVKFKIACSATPIENTILDLWCLVDFVKPGLLGSLKDFKKKYSVKNADDDTLEKINDELKSRLNKSFIRRTKDVLNSQGKEFPKKIIIYEHLKYSEEQKEKLIKLNQMKLEGASVLPLIGSMIMTCSHPKLIEKDDEIGLDLAKLENDSLKLLNVKKILELVKEKNEKAIIFTKYRKMQKILSILLKEWFEFNPNIVNGDNTSDIRKKILDKYRNSSGFNVIILSPEAAGVGLNIVEANHIIHYTRHWNPAKEEQATDRAYRIGQKKDVYVYYPLVSEDDCYGRLEFNTADEWIESTKFNFSKVNSPEEKLNRIILKKKKLLRDFFLAAPIDLNSDDFDEFKETEVKDDTILNIEHVDLLDWSYLEIIAILLMEKEYKGKGYLTKRTGDFGVDGLIEVGNNEAIVIQVKKSKNKVGKEALEEVLYGRKIYERELNLKIKKVIVITNSETTKLLSEDNLENIEIIDRKILSLLLQKYNITLDIIKRFREN